MILIGRRFRRFIENSIEQFSNSFGNAVSEEPEKMIKLVLINKEEILEEYVNSLFSGVAYSKVLDNVPIELLETMIFELSIRLYFIPGRLYLLLD